jgi:signal transduction histidine kinase
MTATGQRRAAAAAWAVVVALTAAGLAGTIAAWADLVTSDAIANLCMLPAAVLYATLGTLIVRRAGNVIGWYLIGGGISSAVVASGSAYAILGVRNPGMLPAPRIAGVLAQWSFLPLIFGIAFMLLVFPTGNLPSRRWRPAGIACLLVIALTMIGLLIYPGTVALPAPGGISLVFRNPLGVRSLAGPLPAQIFGGIDSLWWVFIALMSVSTVALTVRYRHGARELRQQIKWIAFTAATAIGGSVVVLASMSAGKAWTPLTTAGDLAVTIIGLAGFPIAIAFAVLKYGLYQIDVVISRALTYGLLSAALTAVYAGIVVGIGTLAGYAGGPLLTVAAAVVVSVLFHPLRQRASLLANRFVYGKRASPYQVLADFAQLMAGLLDADAALDRMAALLAAATGAVRVEVWVLVGAGLSPRSVWPAGASPGAAPGLASVTPGDAAAPDPVSRAIGVRHKGELLGMICLQKARNEPVSAADETLLADVASQAGLVLRNAGLTAELQATIDDLRASRRRLVRAQDEERQRIERNLHDGAQQQLVALSVQLSLLEDAADDPGEVRDLAGELRAGVRAALDDLRALARGIYPPVLADQGLRAALQAQAERVPVPVLIDADGIGRISRDGEAALYFCILEALQNVAKYARATLATVTLTRAADGLEFTVTDDGAGFDLEAAATGTGLQGMADRLSAAGGQLRIESAPGRGTIVSGAVPG